MTAAVVQPAYESDDEYHVAYTPEPDSPTSGLCRGVTQQNKPCRRKGGARGYCHQHQDQIQRAVTPISKKFSHTGTFLVPATPDFDGPRRSKTYRDSPRGKSVFMNLDGNLLEDIEEEVAGLRWNDLRRRCVNEGVDARG